MAANAALWSTIEKGLQEARWCVLLASPESASSTYVNDEMAWWVRNKGAHTVLLVRAGGNIQWDKRAGAFANTPNAIPPALRYAYAEEPRWVDMAWFAESDSLGKADPRFLERVADLSSAIRGVERDALIGENVRQHRKTRRLARAAVSALAALLVVALGAGVVAFIQRGEAVRQRDTAVEQSLVARARQLAATAVNAADSDLQQALLLATTAYKTRQEQQTEVALHTAITKTPQLVGFFDFGEEVTLVDASPEAGIIVGGSQSGKVFRIDRTSGDRKAILDLHSPVDFLAVSDDGKTVAASASINGENGRASSQSALWQDGRVTELSGERLMAMSPSGRTRVAMPKTAKALDPDVLVITSDGRTTSVTTPGSATHWVELPDDTVVVSMNEYGEYMRARIDGSAMETTRTPMGLWMFGGNLSPDGNSFTYTNTATEVEVWNLAGPLLPEYGDSPMVGVAPDVQLSALALNVKGTRLATAADGAIYVSDVLPRGQSKGFTQLRGAGPSPHSLKFLSDDVILSASESSAAVWDLRRTVPLATVTPADVGDSCSACWAPEVVPSPNGEKVVITNDFGSSFVNVKTGFNATHWSYDDDATSEGGAALQAASATAWLDNDRLFAYDAKNGNGWVLRGDDLAEVDRSFDLPPGKDTTQVAVQFDRTLLVLSGNTLFTVDPNSGDYKVADPPATALSPGGGYAVEIAEPKNGKTAVKVIDTDGFDVVRDVTVEGSLQNFAVSTGDGLALLRNVGPDKMPDDTELLFLNLQDGSVRTVSRFGIRIIAENVAATRDTMFVEENGFVAMRSLRDASKVQLLPVKSAVRAWNGLGVTSDASTLVVASETVQSVMRLPVTGDAWTSIACEVAGRDVRAGDIDGVVSSIDGLIAGCGDRIRR